MFVSGVGGGGGGGGAGKSFPIEAIKALVASIWPSDSLSVLLQHQLAWLLSM